MAKVLGMHTVALKPGVNEQEFEEFFRTEVLPLYRKVPGQTAYLLKGDRGERAGKYLLVIELESAERRDQIYPAEGTIAEEVLQLVGNIEPFMAAFSNFATDFPDPKYTDYVMVSD